MTSKHKLQFSLLALALIPMALLAIYASKRLPAQMPFHLFFILPQQSAIAWNLGPSHYVAQPNPAGRTRSIQFDLFTGRLTSQPYAPFQVVDRAPDGSLMIQQFTTRQVENPLPGVDIVKRSADGKVLEQPLQVDRSLAVVNHRFIISARQNNIVALDTESENWRRPAVIPICADTSPQSYEDIWPIEGSNHLLLNRSPTPNSVSIYSIENGKATVVATWPTGRQDARAVVRKGQVYSLAPHGFSLEVRESSQYALVRSLPLPTNMIDQWSRATCGHTVCTIQHPKTGTYESYRLEDLTPIPELENLAPLKLPYGQTGHNRYHLFTPTDGSKTELIIYDGQEHRIQHRLHTGYPYVDARVVGDDKLVVLDHRSGVTCKLIDLNTGSITAVYRPLFWAVLGTLALNISTLVWVAAWLRHSRHARLPAFLDWLVLGVVLGVPLLVRTWTCTWLMTSSSMNLFHACWLVTTLAASYNLWFGPSRIVHRVCLWMMILIAGASVLQLREWFEPTQSTVALSIVWLHLLTNALVFILVVRIITIPKLGVEINRSTHIAKDGANHTRLFDLFVLTTVCALLFGSLLSMAEHLKNPFELMLYSWFLSSVTLTSMVLAAYLFLTKWKWLNNLGVGLAVVASLLFMGDWIIGLVDYSYFTTYLWLGNLSELAKLASICFLVAAAWSWRRKTRNRCAS